MTAHTAIRQAPFIGWTASTEARALLADCATNPPERRRMLAPLAQVFSGGPEYVWRYDRNDERVDALRQLQDRAFGELEQSDRAHLHAMLTGIDEAIDFAKLPRPYPPQDGGTR